MRGFAHKTIFYLYCSHLPVPVEPQKQVYCIPNLLPRLNIVGKKAAGTAVPALVEVGRQHDDGLLRGWWHLAVEIRAF